MQRPVSTSVLCIGSHWPLCVVLYMELNPSFNHGLSLCGKVYIKVLKKSNIMLDSFDCVNLKGLGNGSLCALKTMQR